MQLHTLRFVVFAAVLSKDMYMVVEQFKQFLKLSLCSHHGMQNWCIPTNNPLVLICSKFSNPQS